MEHERRENGGVSERHMLLEEITFPARALSSL
jgi:hypothetical protein